jgi:hypothetical protein
LKGLPSRPQDVETVKTEPPMFHAIHEFELEVEKLDNEKALETISTEWAKRIFANATKSEYGMYKLEKTFGDGKFFHEE